MIQQSRSALNRYRMQAQRPYAVLLNGKSEAVRPHFSFRMIEPKSFFDYPMKTQTVSLAVTKSEGV